MRKIRRTLEAAGLLVWTDDYEHEPGNWPWRFAVTNAIQKSECVVAVLTSEAENSRWMQHELIHAESHQKAIFTIQVKGSTRNLLVGFQPEMQVTLNPNYDLGMNRLIAALRKYLKLPS